MDLETFRTLHPEFEPVLDQVVQSKLDQAAERLDAAIYGRLYDQAHEHLAAHLIVTSPFGHSARLEADQDGTSLYWPEFERIRKLVAPRVMVI